MAKGSRWMPRDREVVDRDLGLKFKLKLSQNRAAWHQNLNPELEHVPSSLSGTSNCFQKQLEVAKCLRWQLREVSVPMCWLTKMTRELKRNRDNFCRN